MSNSYFSYTSQLCSFLACTMVELIHLLPSLSWYWLQIYTCKMPNEPTLFETPFFGPNYSHLTISGMLVLRSRYWQS